MLSFFSKDFKDSDENWELLRNTNSLSLFMTSSLLIMGTVLISPIIPSIISHYGITEAKVSLIMALFTFPTIILSPIIGILADYYGCNLFLSLGLFIYGLAGILIGAINPNYNSLLLLRGFQGVGFALSMPLTVALLGDLFKGAKETAAQGIREVFNGLGETIYPVIGGLLVVFGWNYPFFCYTAALPLGVVIWFSFPDTKTSYPSKDYFKNIYISLKNSEILLILISGLIRFFAKYGIFSFLPLLMFSRLNISAALVGILMSSQAISRSMISSQAGVISRKWGLIKPLILGFLLINIAFIALPFSHSIAPLIILIILYGLGDGLLGPMQKSLITQNTRPKQRASIVSLNSSLYNIGKTASPFLLGIIVSNSNLNLGFWACGIIISLLLFILTFFSFTLKE